MSRRWIVIAVACALVLIAVGVVTVGRRRSSSGRADPLVAGCSPTSSATAIRWTPQSTNGLPTDNRTVLGDVELFGAPVLFTTRFRHSAGVEAGVPAVFGRRDSGIWFEIAVPGFEQGGVERFDVRQLSVGNLHPALAVGRIITGTSSQPMVWSVSA